MDQDYRLCTPRAFPPGILSPEKCIVVVLYNPVQQEKADALDAAEGSNPELDMASIQGTTGVLDQGMFSKE